MDDKKKLERIAQKVYLLICDMAEVGEDYSLLLRQYNEMVEDYNLSLKPRRIIWVSPTEFQEK